MASYKKSKKTFMSLGTAEICKLLVPKPRKHKELHKLWMRLLIHHKSDCVDYIFELDINQSDYNENDYDPINVPQHLKSLLNDNEIILNKSTMTEPGPPEEFVTKSNANEMTSNKHFKPISSLNANMNFDDTTTFEKMDIQFNFDSIMQLNNILNVNYNIAAPTIQEIEEELKDYETNESDGCDENEDETKDEKYDQNTNWNNKAAAKISEASQKKVTDRRIIIKVESNRKNPDAKMTTGIHGVNDKSKKALLVQGKNEKQINKWSKKPDQKTSRMKANERKNVQKDKKRRKKRKKTRRRNKNKKQQETDCKIEMQQSNKKQMKLDENFAREIAYGQMNASVEQEKALRQMIDIEHQKEILKSIQQENQSQKNKPNHTSLPDRKYTGDKNRNKLGNKKRNKNEERSSNKHKKILKIVGSNQDIISNMNDQPKYKPVIDDFRGDSIILKRRQTGRTNLPNHGQNSPRAVYAPHSESMCRGHNNKNKINQSTQYNNHNNGRNGYFGHNYNHNYGATNNNMENTRHEFITLPSHHGNSSNNGDNCGRPGRISGVLTGRYNQPPDNCPSSSSNTYNQTIPYNIIINGHWKCSVCNYVNYARRKQCRRCSSNINLIPNQLQM